MEATWRQRLVEIRENGQKKRRPEKYAVQELKQEKYKRQATEEKLLYTEKKKDKFYQMWRQVEREKEKITSVPDVSRKEIKQ